MKRTLLEIQENIHYMKLFINKDEMLFLRKSNMQEDVQGKDSQKMINKCCFKHIH